MSVPTTHYNNIDGSNGNKTKPRQAPNKMSIENNQ